jgi:hypothetical protein
MTNKSYNCSQQELYTICRLGWQSCNQHLANFSAFKARYTAPYIAERQEEVEAAANLPDEQARTSDSEVFRIQLEQLAATCMADWQKLKRYIADSWPPELQKPKTDAAGQNYYNKAGNNDWEACRGLITAGSNFIAANLGTLTDNDNMPATFQDTFNADKTAFETKHQEFLDSEESSSVATENKITANNDIHSKVMVMFLDGQEIFKDNEAVKKQFVFDQVLNLASGTGTAGVRGTVTDSTTSAPIANAAVTFVINEKTSITDEDGKYQVTQVAAGTYSISFIAEGYVHQTVSQQIKTGTISTLNIQLVPEG